MKSDVEVTVNGMPFTGAAVTGVTVQYAYNQIPMAQLDLSVPYLQSKEGLAFLCNPDQQKAATRQNPVTINVKTATGCLNFRGFFDGLSLSQSVGSLSYSAVFKSELQYLAETYPKFIGADPASILPMRRLPGIDVIMNAEDATYAQFRGPLTTASTGVNLQEITTIEAIFKLYKASLESQLNYPLYTNTSNREEGFLKLLDSESYKRAINKAIALLDSVDLSATAGTKLRAFRNSARLIDDILYTPGTIWQGLLSILADFGCVIVPGNEKMFVVPEALFMKQQGLSTPGFRDRSQKPNVANPVDYNSFSIADVSYKNIRACIVVPTEVEAIGTLYSFASGLTGSYPKSASSEIADDGSVGILSVEVPQALMHNIEVLYLNETTQTNVSSNKSLAEEPTEEVSEEVKNRMKEQAKKVEEKAKNLVEEVLDEYAKMRFLREKYFERGGVVNLLFNPKWVPGSTGCVFTRLPGLFYCFYTSSVLHYIQCNSGTGNATTTVNFNATRFAGQPGNISGVDEIALYNYNPGKMAEFQNSWLSDIGAK